MKLSINVEADSVSVLALNLGKIAVEVEGIELAGLVDAVNQNGVVLHVADEMGSINAENSRAPMTSLIGIRCSTAHITDGDNALLFQASHRLEEFGNAEWVHFTGTGYLLRLSAWQYPVLRLKRMGLSKTCRRLVVTLMQSDAIDILHLDAFGDVLSGLVTFD
ncbi:TPA: DUF5983 family protein [Yersinia enterocolitica]|nr:hypothetical protein [Yersinia enterocolitica]HDL7695300.1 hypothetical protein [Yersinia enterocolitica]HDL8189316.1 hypothetical protein [Yersinia enterocolitica]HDL8213343.1 hypothetical protein [Yersinia enterocolitica]HDL8218105.1 hypothetical protein [Yersinia enterocolitica]